MSQSNIDAFNMGAAAQSSEVNVLLLGLFFSVLFIIIAYVLIQGYEKLQNGGSVKQFLLLGLRMIFMFCLLSYFLLR